MRLKSKHVPLVALIVLTTMPRALDQLTDLKNFAQERARVELLSIFYSFTPPESRSDNARQASEYVARLQAAAPACNGTDEAVRGARVVRASGRFARSTRRVAPALEPRQQQPFVLPEEPTPDNSIADARLTIDKSGEFLAPPGLAPLDLPKKALLDKLEKFVVVVVSRNHKTNVIRDDSADPPISSVPAQVGDFNGSMRPPTCMVR